MGKLSTTLKWRGFRALRFWDHLSIRAQGGITVFIPIIAIMVSFGFAIYGNFSRASSQADIQRKFQAVRQYSDLLTLMIDGETGERGFILTRRDEYLEPYKKATEEIPHVIAQLKETIEAEPGENPRQERIEALAKIQELIDRQLVQLKESQNFTRDKVSDQELYEHLQHGKMQMDEIRTNVSAMQNKEEVLLSNRISEINAIRNRDYVIIFVTLLIAMLVRAIAFYLFDRGIIRRIHRITEYIDTMIKGEPGHFTESKKTDALGVLEGKVLELSQQLGNGRSS